MMIDITPASTAIRGVAVPSVPFVPSAASGATV